METIVKLDNLEHLYTLENPLRTEFGIYFATTLKIFFDSRKNKIWKKFMRYRTWKLHWVPELICITTGCSKLLDKNWERRNANKYCALLELKLANQRALCKLNFSWPLWFLRILVWNFKQSLIPCRILITKNSCKHPLQILENSYRFLWILC